MKKEKLYTSPVIWEFQLKAVNALCSSIDSVTNEALEVDTEIVW